MLNSLLALIAMVGSPGTGMPSAPLCAGMPVTSVFLQCGLQDELPPEVLAVVLRVDRQAQEGDPKLVKPAADSDEEKKKEAKHQADLKADIELGKKYAAEIEKDPKLKPSTNAEMTARVQRIGSEVAAIANDNQVEVSWGDPRMNPFPYQFKVLQGEDVNAFSIPGGFIYVYEGLVKYAESDDELAGVIAHEISHAAFRHIATLRHEASKIDVIQIPLILLAILTGGTTAEGLLIGGGLLGTALTSGWSVKAEQAADYGGFQYMRKSKYNPLGMLTLMERLAYDERNKPQFDWGIYRTHPPSRERAAAIMKRLSDAQIPIRRSQVTQTLRTQVKPGDQGSVDLWYANIKLYSFAGTDALTRADIAASNIDLFFDGLPKIFEIGADQMAIEGKGKPLFFVTEEDATAAKKKPEDMVDESLKALKRAAYDLSYRVWDAQFLGGGG